MPRKCFASSQNHYRSSDSKLWALRSVTSVSVDKADVDEEMDEAVEARLDEVVEEDWGVADDEEDVTAVTGVKGWEVDRFNPSRSDLAGVWFKAPLPLAALAACLERNEPGLLQEGISSSDSIIWPDCCDGEDGKASTSVAGGGGGRDGGPLDEVLWRKTNQIKSFTTKSCIFNDNRNNYPSRRIIFRWSRDGCGSVGRGCGRFGSFFKGLLDGKRGHGWRQFPAAVLLFFVDHDDGTRHFIGDFGRGLDGGLLYLWSPGDRRSNNSFRITKEEK